MIPAARFPRYHRARSTGGGTGGIEAANAAGFTNIKINSVLLKEVTDRTLPDAGVD
ncbi:MAG: hypothetical protein U1E36_02490 [Rickettsiales bacterium]